MYEIAWFRRLQLVFGVSSFAVGAVVCSFMIGLAAGSRWAGSTKAPSAHPLKAYAVIEVLIALYALCFPLLVVLMERLYSSVFGLLEGHFLILSLLRFVLSLLVLLPATFCMGATLPILARSVSPDHDRASRQVGWLYAANTFGGVVGTLVAGFFTLEHLGIAKTVYLAACINLLIAAAALSLAYRALKFTQGKAQMSRKPVLGFSGSSPLRFACFIVGSVGLVSMALEVVWTRALVFYIHNSTYAFSAILAVYLLGIAVGAAVGAKLSSGRNPLISLNVVLVAMCFSTLLAIAVYRQLPELATAFLSEPLDPTLAGLPGESPWIVRSWMEALVVIFAQVGAVLFLPSFLFGATFPLALRIAHEGMQDTAATVGTLYAVNTSASVVGTVLGSFVLVPLFGTRLALVMLSWLVLPVAVVAVFQSARSLRVRLSVVGSTVISLVIVTLLAAPAGFYRKMFEDRFGRVLWFSEGISETVAICRHEDGSDWIQYSDGRGASGTTSFKGGWLYAHLPLLLHENPQSALVICFGTGNTLGAANLHRLDRLTGVELSTEVVKASHFFKETNHDVANAEGVNIAIGDGRNFLLGTDECFDIITEEPPLVHTAGVVNLYTKDFYELCAKRLTEDGIMAVWLATWEMEEQEVQMLVRAFFEAFPHVSAWDSMHLGEWILVGSKQPIRIDVESLRARISTPQLAGDLQKIGIDEPEDILALYLKGRDFLAKFSNGVPPVTDDRSVVDYTIPRRARANFGLGEFLSGGLSVSGVGPSGLVSELRVREFDSIYTSRDSVKPLLTGMPPAELSELLRRVGERQVEAEIASGKKITWNILATALDLFKLKETQRAHEVLDWGVRTFGGKPSADLLVMGAALYRQAGDLQKGRELLLQALELDPTNAQALRRLGEAPRGPSPTE